jgi:glycosyltransferase involved in cell wall biosynthesis
MRVTRKVNLFVLFIGGEGMLIPMIALKLLRKKVVVMPGGIATKVASTRKDPLTKILSLLISFDLSLADRLIIYSPLLAKKFVKHQRRVLIAHEHFVDLSKFVVKKKIDERLSIVGYIGRLSEEKGVLNLIEAVPLVLKIKPSTQFLICGKGDLSDKVKKIIKDKELEEHVKLNGWVLHEDVPRVLNELKLLVLPSYTEGLPNITLEAMACGTPVLATPVGAIPDVIKDGETGFLLKSNDPEHIAKKIIELLSKPELLEKVSINAYKYVRENFSYERTLESWRRILGELDSRE